MVLLLNMLKRVSTNYMYTDNVFIYPTVQITNYKLQNFLKRADENKHPQRRRKLKQTTQDCSNYSNSKADADADATVTPFVYTC